MQILLAYSTSYLPIILTILYVIKYKSYRKLLAYKLFCTYLGFISMVEITSSILFFYEINNLFFSHVYFMGEFFLLSLFFRKLLLNDQKKKASLLIAIIVSSLVILIVFNALEYFDLSSFHPLEILICALPILVLAATHLYNSLVMPLKYLYITIGVIIYKTVSVLVFILQNFANAISDFNSFSFILLKLNSVFLLVYYGLIFFEWFKNFRQKKIS